jgi:hypothetical protein
MGGSDSEEF